MLAPKECAMKSGQNFRNNQLKTETCIRALLAAARIAFLQSSESCLARDAYKPLFLLSNSNVNSSARVLRSEERRNRCHYHENRHPRMSPKDRTAL